MSGYRGYLQPLNRTVLADERVDHRFTLEHGLIQVMEVLLLQQVNH